MTLETARIAGSLQSDIISFKEFIAAVEKCLNDPIQSLYFSTEKGIRIEIKKKFSPETSNAIIELLLNSRKAILARLESQLNNLT